MAMTDEEKFLQSLNRREARLVSQLEAIRKLKQFYQSGGTIFGDESPEVPQIAPSSEKRSKRSSKRIEELTNAMIDFFGDEEEWHAWEIISRMEKKYPKEPGEAVFGSYIQNFCTMKFTQWSKSNNGPIMRISRGLYKKRK